MPEDKAKCKKCGKEFVPTETTLEGLCPKCHKEKVDAINEG